jgi:hypothetical protein
MSTRNLNHFGDVTVIVASVPLSKVPSSHVIVALEDVAFAVAHVPVDACGARSSGGSPWGGTGGSSGSSLGRMVKSSVSTASSKVESPGLVSVNVIGGWEIEPPPRSVRTATVSGPSVPSYAGSSANA